MLSPKLYTHAVSALVLMAAFATGAAAQNTADQAGETERQDALEGQPGQNDDNSAPVTASDSHSSATNCTDLLAEENRAQSEAAQDEANRRSASVGQVTQSTESADNDAAGTTSTNEIVTGNSENSRVQSNVDIVTLSVEECQKQQDLVLVVNQIAARKAQTECTEVNNDSGTAKP